MFSKDSLDVGDLFISEVEHVHVPGAGHLDLLDPQDVEDRALDGEVGVDLVSEPGRDPHRVV